MITYNDKKKEKISLQYGRLLKYISGRTDFKNFLNLDKLKKKKFFYIISIH